MSGKPVYGINGVQIGYVGSGGNVISTTFGSSGVQLGQVRNGSFIPTPSPILPNNTPTVGGIRKF